MRMRIGLIFTILSILSASALAGTIEYMPRSVSIFFVVCTRFQTGTSDRQIPQFVFVSLGEILLSVTAFEFAYTEAPQSFRGLTTAVWLLTIGIGYLIDAAVGISPQARGWNMFYAQLAFAGVTLLITFFFTFITRNYKYSAPQAMKDIQ
jgi:dipeptide/tripeptide permease